MSVEAVVGGASWLIGKVWTQLSNDLVAAYVASTKLGLNMQQIKRDLLYTQGLLQTAQGRKDLSDNPSLQKLLEDLSKKADEAEDALDELQYFIIQDQIDGTHEAIPDIQGHQALHGRHALHHTIGNWFPCFFHPSARDDANNSHHTTKSHGDINDHVANLTFNRVGMCNKIKSVIEDIHALCTLVSELLKINHASQGKAASLKRPPTSSTITQDKLYGRENIFKQTLDDMTNCTTPSRTLSVLPIVGPGGIGKTTFTQHLYNDKRTEVYFCIKVWVCISTNFNVLRLTQEILKCIPHIGSEGSNVMHESSNLDQLQKTIAQRLQSKRFLLVLDDMWKCGTEAEWKSLLAPFTKGEAKGSMILVTTRFPSIAQILKTAEPIELQGLEDREFFTFFEECIIGCSRAENNKIEDKGLEYLDELIGKGFLMKIGDDKCWYYIMHDLLHDLAKSVSSQECINISPHGFRSDNIPQSIRHVSITFQDSYGQSFKVEMENLKRKIDIENLRTLMFFGDYSEDMIIFFKNIFKETKCLRVLFMFATSLESFPYNFSKLIHLRYLKVEVPYGIELSLPSVVCRFYHLKYLNLLEHRDYILPKDISRLVNLHHLIGRKELRSNIHGIGKMKYLQKLEEFHVKKESIGFELRELGDLTELRGELEIHNLENIATREEANDAKLMLKRNLKTLKLVWGVEQQITGSNVIDGLQPHPNLRALDIRNHGGSTGPSWLCSDICLKRLKYLRLEGISWGTLPPFAQLMHLEELILINAGIQQLGPDFGGATQKSFLHLKNIEFIGMQELVGWVGGAHCHMFSKLASIRCEDCPKLSMLLLPSSEFSASSAQDINTIWFPSLSSLEIKNCPKLSLPPMPHTTILTHVTVIEDEKTLLYFDEDRLRIEGYGGALAFHNLDKVEDMTIEDMSHVSLNDILKLNSLTSLHVIGCETMFLSEVEEDVIFRSVQQLSIARWYDLIGKSLTKLSKYFPALTEFTLNMSPEGQGEEDVVLRVPWSSLSYFQISGYVNLVLPMEDGGGLQYLSTLQKMEIWSCGKMFTLWSTVEAGALSSKPFPPSLRQLDISEESSMPSMALLSNLTSLTNLKLVECVNLTIDGFDPIITRNLNELVVYNYSTNDINNHRCSIAEDLISEVARMTKVIPEAGCFQQLKKLEVDSISAVFVAPICSLLATTLCDLKLISDLRMENFTEKQEEALQLLTSLRNLEFEECVRLQSLPKVLHRLSSLCSLQINQCPHIKSLPNEGFPASLKDLVVERCSTDLLDQAKKLRSSYYNLNVYDTSSQYFWREIDMHACGTIERKKHCQAIVVRFCILLPMVVVSMRFRTLCFIRELLLQ
ncbi:disease resistance protein RGA2-like [Oryza glaberrima]|uniref:disease resistance protein RGA2-like n=1 Tax=Oryza glaberrima TaxID=4538 RepID=UPI00224C1074|nr:disease resistance protein RGA2-like [Oryza glaberrima]